MTSNDSPSNNQPDEDHDRSFAMDAEEVLEESVLDETTSSSKGLFDDLLAGDPIFENKEVLRPSYTPDELPHRADQRSSAGSPCLPICTSTRRPLRRCTGYQS